METEYMSGSIGQKFLHARKLRKETLEDVAFKTRIPTALLGDMENDDLSNFGNLTYARSFLKLYSRYLDVDISDYLDEFNTSELASISGHEYIQAANAVHALPPLLVVKDPPRTRLWLTLAVIGAIIAIPILWVKYHPSEDTPSPETNPPAASTAVPFASTPPPVASPEKTAPAEPAPPSVPATPVAEPVTTPEFNDNPAAEGAPAPENSETRPALPVNKAEVVPEEPEPSNDVGL